MGPSTFCTSASIPSIVAVESSRETQLVPWISLLPSTLLSRGLSERCPVSMSMYGTWTMEFFVRSAGDLSVALAIIKAVEPARGLFLNRGKSLLHIPRDTTPDHNPLQWLYPLPEMILTS